MASDGSVPFTSRQVIRSARAKRNDSVCRQTWLSGSFRCVTHLPPSPALAVGRYGEAWKRTQIGTEVRGLVVDSGTLTDAVNARPPPNEINELATAESSGVQ
jgi:hypothetical protein